MNPTHDEIRELARQSPLLRQGELEMDLAAPVSSGDDNGAYVQTWMWVNFEGTPFDREKPKGTSA